MGLEVDMVRVVLTVADMEAGTVAVEAKVVARVMVPVMVMGTVPVVVVDITRFVLQCRILRFESYTYLIEMCHWYWLAHKILFPQDVIKRDWVCRHTRLTKQNK
jgi:hypothetical protein